MRKKKIPTQVEKAQSFGKPLVVLRLGLPFAMRARRGGPLGSVIVIMAATESRVSATAGAGGWRRGRLPPGLQHFPGAAQFPCPGFSPPFQTNFTGFDATSFARQLRFGHESSGCVRLIDPRPAAIQRQVRERRESDVGAIFGAGRLMEESRKLQASTT